MAKNTAMLRAITLTALLLFTGILLQGQKILLDGYTFEDDNRGYLSKVRVQVFVASTGELAGRVLSDEEGHFLLELPAGNTYKVVANKDRFVDTEERVSTIGKQDGEKVFVKLKMEREPGYVFDVTLLEGGRTGAEIYALDSARIEVYNNTQRKEELVLNPNTRPTFNFTFQKGNHYTIMVRKKGFLTKRMEAYVDIEGCILCFEGLGTVEPGVTDLMTYGNEQGTFLANVQLEPVKLDRKFRLENIYYDYDKWDIRNDAAKELDNLVTVLNDNPGISVELGSHTDARGRDTYNLDLSSKRAKSAVEYLVTVGGIDPNRLTYKGYGETELTNRCRDGVTCSDAEHQQNRRTEIKITGIAAEDPLDQKSLKEILEEERLLKEVLNQTPVQIPVKKQ